MNEKYQMKLERLEIPICGYECCILDSKKVLSWNKLRKMKCLCKIWIFVWNACTLKEMVQFVHEVHPVFAVIAQLLHTCYVGQMMIPCQVSTFLSSGCSPFQFQGHLAENKSLNEWKISNEVRKGWNFSMWLWMLHVGCKKSLELK